MSQKFLETQILEMTLQLGCPQTSLWYKFQQILIDKNEILDLFEIDSHAIFTHLTLKARFLLNMILCSIPRPPRMLGAR